MNNNEQDKLLKLYTLAELAYQNHFENTTDNNDNLYPEGWYENKNYRLKIEIITDAIQSNTLIENTPKYQEMVEGVTRKLIKE